MIRPSAPVALLALATLTGGCLTYRPIIVDRKTDFEAQLLGRFERLHERPSAAAALPLARGATALGRADRLLVQAVLDSELLREATHQSKRAQLVGEGREGLLVVVTMPASDDERERLARLVTEVNAWRQSLMQAVIASDATLSASDLPEVQRVFHRLQRATAAPGDLVQDADGRWTAAGAHSLTPSRPADFAR
ncbi:MAG: DUF1318 domain-containing protein [Proteobacteria bacterium]|nr:DUF1318 domain-containing protein [Pseudomonadota bacterium]